jgi:regulator of protease activity HflC (stomatin/prohibitin superfamily)
MAIIIAILLIAVGYIIGSAKIVNQGYEALVERLGRFRKKLSPGVSFIVPFLDTIVWEETTREQILNVDPQDAITKDNVSLKANAVVYWRIFDMRRAYYAIDDLELAIKNLVITALRAELGEMKLEQTFSARKEINQLMLQSLDDVTESWGVKLTRVEVIDIKPAEAVLKSMEQERAAEIKKRAAKLEAESTGEYMKQISEILKTYPNSREVLQFLLAQKYVDANLKLGDSTNSKIIFMDPKTLNEAIRNLMEDLPEIPNHPPNGNKP